MAKHWCCFLVMLLPDWSLNLCCVFWINKVGKLPLSWSCNMGGINLCILCGESIQEGWYVTCTINILMSRSDQTIFQTIWKCIEFNHNIPQSALLKLNRDYENSSNWNLIILGKFGLGKNVILKDYFAFSCVLFFIWWVVTKSYFVVSAELSSKVFPESNWFGLQSWSF